MLANANDMPFADASFDLVMSVSTLEHDKHFWLSLAEMKRVLRPGGVLAIAVPGYVKDPERDRGRWTRTYRVHGRMGDAVYLSLCVYGGPTDGRWSTASSRAMAP